MKTLIALVLLAALSACSDGTSKPETVTSSEVVQSATVTPNATPEPVKTLFCTAEITTNCEVKFCPQGVDGCPTSLPPLPILNVDCPENHKHGCPQVKLTPPVQQPILNVVCEENPERGCYPNSTPKKEPMPVPVEYVGCWTECDTSTGM